MSGDLPGGGDVPHKHPVDDNPSLRSRVLFSEPQQGFDNAFLDISLDALSIVAPRAWKRIKYITSNRPLLTWNAQSARQHDNKAVRLTKVTNIHRLVKKNEDAVVARLADATQYVVLFFFSPLAHVAYSIGIVSKQRQVLARLLGDQRVELCYQGRSTTEPMIFDHMRFSVELTTGHLKLTPAPLPESTPPPMVPRSASATTSPPARSKSAPCAISPWTTSTTPSSAVSSISLGSWVCSQSPMSGPSAVSLVSPLYNSPGPVVSVSAQSSPSYARARRKRPSKRMNPLWRSSSFHKTLPDADSQPAVLPRNPPASAPDTPADSPPASPPAYPTALGFMVNLGTTSCAANAGTSATPTPPSSFSDNDTVILDSADFDNSTGTGGFAQIPWAPGRRFSRIQAQQAMDLEPRGSPPNL